MKGTLIIQKTIFEGYSDNISVQIHAIYSISIFFFPILDPDVRGHDGVYSRYVTWLPGEGRYALTATASDNHGSASTLTLRTDGK